MALSLVLDVTCEGDPAEWAQQHQELTAAACARIHYWGQERGSDQILEVFHQGARIRGGTSVSADQLPRSSAKAPEYCETIDGLISEAAAVEIIRSLDHDAAARILGTQQESAIDEAIQQLPHAPAAPDLDVWS
jgi:hypothetical protein